MKKLLLATAATIAVASPAVAQQTGGYVGLEGGILFPQTTKVDVTVDTVTVSDAGRLHYSEGFDVDLIGGYDLGMFRLEGELAYKQAGVDRLEVTGEPDAAVDGNAHVLSAMLNGLVDFDTGGVGVYAGGGFGHAWVGFSGDDFEDATDEGWAYQLIAGVHIPVSTNMDVGVKYRYFQTERLRFDTDFEDATLSGKFRSHSILASVVFNFGRAMVSPPPPLPPPPPPPPPPEAPAMQTCPDGSVISASDMCAAPAPPPPPPPPAPERG